MNQSTDRKIVTLDDIERRHVASHIEPYFNWIRHVVTLAAGALTVLVALQGHYVPRSPQLLVALAVCWVALVATIALGLWALRAQYISPLAAAGRLRTMRAALGDNETARRVSQGNGTPQPWHHKWAVRLMLVFFLVALSSLCVFAVANLGVWHG
jgi:hypothetical protein